MSYTYTERLVNSLINNWFTDNKIQLSDNQVGDSCNYHAITHEETEILGIFCDITAIHGDDLKEVLIRGYLSRMTKPKGEYITMNGKSEKSMGVSPITGTIYCGMLKDDEWVGEKEDVTDMASNKSCI